MTRTFLSLAGALGLAIAGGGCASISTGTTQAISVNSDPTEADCTLTREGQLLGTVKTPGPVTVKRDSRTIHVVCAKEGYEDGKIILNSRYETASAGNMILGGVIGVIVDSSTGASNRYDTQVTVPLTPRVGGQVRAPAVSSPPSASSPVPPTATRPAPTAATDSPGSPASVAPVSGQSRSRL